MPIARKKAIIVKKIRERYAGRPDKCTKVLKYIDLLEDANIPVGYWFLKMADFSGPELFKNFIVEYCNSIDEAYELGRSLCLCGNQGTGKTMSAISILKGALKNKYESQYITAYDLMSIYFDRGDAMQKLRGADFLAVDEVDSRFFTSDAQKEIFSAVYETLLRYRVHNTLPTIICTNENHNIYEPFIGQSKHAIESLYSQSVQIVPVAGRDFRKNDPKVR
jgi:DNA replication protein DnaC